jgi:hypothetical protein
MDDEMDDDVGREDDDDVVVGEHDVDDEQPRGPRGRGDQDQE